VLPPVCARTRPVFLILKLGMLALCWAVLVTITLYIFSIVRPQSPMVSASFSKLMAKMLAWRTASALHVCSACIEQGARQ
jgi:hypothetical protein